MHALLRRSLALLIALPLAACGGGGGGGDQPPPTQSLRYSEERIEAAVGVPFAPLAPVSSNLPAAAVYAVTPSLPSGLALDPTTGVVSGTPTVLAAADEYEVGAGDARATFELRVSPPTRSLVSGSATEGTLLVQGLDSETGSTRTLDLLSQPLGLPPVSDLVASPELAYVAAAHGAAGVAGTLVVYDVSPTTDELVERGRATLGLGPHRLAVSIDGGTLYATNRDDDTVRAFQVAGGGPIAVGSPLATGDAPESLAFVPTSSTSDVLVVANRGGQSLSSYTVDPGTGALTTATAALSLNGGVPTSVADGRDGASVAVVLENFSLAIAVAVEPSGVLTTLFGGAQTGFGPSAVVLHPAGALALVANQSDGSVSVLRRAAPGAVPQLVQEGLLTVQPGPTCVRFDTAGRFAYVASAATGELSVLRYTPESSPHFTVCGRSRLRVGAGALALLDGTAPFRRALANLYVVDEDDDLLTVLAPQGTNEVLVSPVAPVPTGDRSTGAALAPDGRMLFIVAQGTSLVDAHSLDPSGLPGAVTSTPTATLPVDVAVAPGGRIAVIASQSPPLVTSYSIDGSGAFTQVDVQVLPSPPGHVAIDPVGRTVVATAIAAGQLVTFRLTDSGDLTSAVASTAATGIPRSLAFSPDGRFVVTALETQDRLALYALAVDGTLALVPPATFDGSSTGDRPFGVAVHPRGRFVLSATLAGGSTPGSMGTGAIDVFGLEPNGGALSRIGALVTGLGPCEVQFEPSGHFAYSLNRTGKDLSILSFDAEDGALTAMGAVTLGNRPVRLVLREVTE
jgi:6-phosphogluconolactonase (cycloisomerase 2 family)